MKYSLTAPQISIIIPVYNTEKYLSKCINSVISQSIKDIEVIIINDLSTDNSERIIIDYAEKYDCVRYYKMNKKGFTGGARNFGIQHAKGKYIGFVDSDDWIDSNMYERMINLIVKSNADIAVCGVKTEFHNAHDVSYRYFYEFENVIEGHFALGLLSRRFNQDTPISPIVCNKVYQLNFIKKNQFQFLNNSYNEDDAFNFLSFLNARKVAITPNTFYHYYQRESSITHSFSIKHIDDLIDTFIIIKQYLINNKLYPYYKEDYYSFFEKCLLFVIDLLLLKEQDIQKQNKYFKYLIARSRNIINISEYIDLIGVRRLKKFLSPAIIK